jgi:hypothetical protein
MPSLGLSTKPDQLHTAVDQNFLERAKASIARIGGATPMLPTPSARECRFCDVGLKDCPVRMVVAEAPTLTVSALL